MASPKIAKSSDLASVAWLGLFLPGLMCYVYFLSQHLNQYDEVPNSFVERFSSKLDEIIPPGAKVRWNAQFLSQNLFSLGCEFESFGSSVVRFRQLPRELQCVDTNIPVVIFKWKAYRYLSKFTLGGACLVGWNN